MKRAVLAALVLAVLDQHSRGRLWFYGRDRGPWRVGTSHDEWCNRTLWVRAYPLPQPVLMLTMGPQHTRRSRAANPCTVCAREDALDNLRRAILNAKKGTP